MRQTKQSIITESDLKKGVLKIIHLAFLSRKICKKINKLVNRRRNHALLCCLTCYSFDFFLLLLFPRLHCPSYFINEKILTGSYSPSLWWIDVFLVVQVHFESDCNFIRVCPLVWLSHPRLFKVSASNWVVVCNHSLWIFLTNASKYRSKALPLHEIHVCISQRRVPEKPFGYPPAEILISALFHYWPVSTT